MNNMIPVSPERVMTVRVLDWDEAFHAGSARCGGKGYNLAWLARYGFNVPVGGVLTAVAYAEFMGTPDLACRTRELAGVGADETLNPSEAARLEDLRAAIEGASVPASVRAELVRFLTERGLANTPVAVRSSAISEDSAGASFAGIHHSFLNVRGIEAVEQVILGCYASLWTPQALAYRRRLRLSDQEMACAVVICAMIDGTGGEPDAAGVSFSCDPRSGRRDLVLINAVRGLGETLVGGGVTPEEIRIERRDGRLRVVERCGPPGRVLSESQALELARLILRVHWALGDGQQPQDVEWAYGADRFWLLQARPVTRVPHVTFPEIAAMPIIWSNGNVNEVLPGVPSTLTWSSVQGTLRDVLYESLQAAGYPVPRMDVCRRFYGRLYFDLTAMQGGYYDALGLMPAETNRGLGGHQPEIPVPRGNSLFAKGGFRRLRYRGRLMRALRAVEKSLPREIERVHQEAREFRRVDLSGLSLRELQQRLEKTVEMTAGFFHRYILGSSSAGAWHSMLEKMLKALASERPEALASALVAGTRGVATAEVGYRLVHLAKLARDEAPALQYLRSKAGDPHGWKRLPGGSAFRKGMHELLEEFGHRSVYESELANPRWTEDPSYLLEQIRSLVDSGNLDERDKTARQTRASAEAEVSRLIWVGRPVLRWLTDRARKGAALREAGRSALVAAAGCSRSICLEAGRRMVAAGLLELEDDVFHLSWADLEAYLRGEWDGAGARTLVADRKQQAADWLAVEAPDFLILDSEGSPAALPPEFQPTNRVAGISETGTGADELVLTGLAASAGRASGPCRIIRHPAEGNSLRAGEILVAPSTDPGWTPLFLRAGAVVTQIGGYLSHAAIVAREYGLPAVLNVPRILTSVHDAQLLTVDGDVGRVICHGPSVGNSACQTE